MIKKWQNEWSKRNEQKHMQRENRKDRRCQFSISLFMKDFKFEPWTTKIYSVRPRVQVNFCQGVHKNRMDGSDPYRAQARSRRWALERFCSAVARNSTKLVTRRERCEKLHLKDVSEKYERKATWPSVSKTEDRNQPKGGWKVFWQWERMNKEKKERRNRKQSDSTWGTSCEKSDLIKTNYLNLNFSSWTNPLINRALVTSEGIKPSSRRSPPCVRER